MKKQYSFRLSALRFKRWSRKGYAAFVSIQRAVTIGRLTANVSERFQTKHSSIHSSVLFTDSNTDENREETDVDACGNQIPQIVLIQQLNLLLSIQVATCSLASAPAYYIFQYISKIAEGFSRILKPSAIFLYKYSII